MDTKANLFFVEGHKMWSVPCMVGPCFCFIYQYIKFLFVLHTYMLQALFKDNNFAVSKNDRCYITPRSQRANLYSCFQVFLFWFYCHVYNLIELIYESTLNLTGFNILFFFRIPSKQKFTFRNVHRKKLICVYILIKWWFLLLFSLLCGMPSQVPSVR